MYKNLSLSVRIGLGFGVVLTLLSIVLGVSIHGLNKADEGIAEYRGLARDTNLSSKLLTNMLMVRMNVKDYLITQNDVDLQQYSTYIDKTLAYLEEAEREIQKPERAALIDQIDAEIVAYQKAFAEVIDLIEKRHVVNDTHLVPNGEAMREIINEIIESAFNDGDSDASYHASHVQEKMLVGRLFVVKFLHSNKDSDFDIALKKIQIEFEKEINELDEHLQDEARRALLVKFKQAHAIYVQAMIDIHNLITARNNIISETLDVLGPQIAKAGEDVKLSVMKDQDTLGPMLKTNTKISVEITIILSIIAIVVGAVWAYFLTKNITKPIAKAVNTANLLAQGDLTVDVGKTSKDETGRLLEALQNMASNLKQMISTISDASVELATASDELAEVTEQTSEGIEKQKLETEMVAASMDEMTQTVNNVTDNASHTAHQANNADAEAIAGSQIVGDTITSIAVLSENVNKSSVKLSEVQGEVNNITAILDVIREISDQTNLLALNAAIEAARAGEHGRGFAVVADEVRALAVRTQESTAEIQGIIELLNTSTHSTVEVMTQGKEQADKCIDQASEANKALESITQSISVINDMSQQIASASNQQGVATDNITENIKNVKMIAEENAEISDKTRYSATNIAKLAEHLNQMVIKFKV